VVALPTNFIAVPANNSASTRVTVRARKTDATKQGELLVQLFEGAVARSTVLTTGELTGSLTSYSLNVADADAATIVDYGALRLRLTGYSGSGDLTPFAVADAYLTVPSGTSGVVTGSAALAMVAARTSAGTRIALAGGQVGATVAQAAAANQNQTAAAALALAAGRSAAGLGTAFGQAAVAETDSVSSSASGGIASSAARGETAAVAASGRNSTTASAALAMTAAGSGQTVASAPGTVRPSADIDSDTWATAPLWSKGEMEGKVGASRQLSRAPAAACAPSPVARRD